MPIDPIQNSGDQSGSAEPNVEAQITEGMIGSAIFRSASAFNNKNPLVRHVRRTPGVLHISLGGGLNANELALHLVPSLEADGDRHGGVMGLRYRKAGKSVDLYRPGRAGSVRLEGLSFARFDRAASVARVKLPDLSWPATQSPEAWTRAEQDNTWADESGARLASFVLLRVNVFNPLEPIHFHGWLHEDSYRLSLKLPKLSDLTPIANALAANGHASVQGLDEHGFDIAFAGRRGRLEVRCEIAPPALKVRRARVNESIGPNQPSVDPRGAIHVDELFWGESAFEVGMKSVSELLRELRAHLGDEITTVVAQATVGELDAWTSEARVPDMSTARRMRFALQMWSRLSFEVSDEEMRAHMLKGDPRLDGLSPVAAIAQEGDWAEVAEVVGLFSSFYK